jgi:hypothetical protein
MSTNVARTHAESGAFRASGETAASPRLRFEEVDAFSRDRMLELLVHLLEDGYSITLFDWLDHVPGELRGDAVLAFRATETPRVSEACPEALAEYVERLREEIRRRIASSPRNHHPKG